MVQYSSLLYLLLFVLNQSGFREFWGRYVVVFDDFGSFLVRRRGAREIALCGFRETKLLRICGNGSLITGIVVSLYRIMDIFDVVFGRDPSWNGAGIAFEFCRLRRV